MENKSVQDSRRCQNLSLRSQPSLRGDDLCVQVNLESQRLGVSMRPTAGEFTVGDEVTGKACERHRDHTVRRTRRGVDSGVVWVVWVVGLASQVREYLVVFLEIRCSD